VSDYLGYLREGFPPYDPLELLRQTEQKVCREEARKYTTHADFLRLSAKIWAALRAPRARGVHLRSHRLISPR